MLMCEDTSPWHLVHVTCWISLYSSDDVDVDVDVVAVDSFCCQYYVLSIDFLLESVHTGTAGSSLTGKNSDDYFWIFS